jgi:hypothetical protein
MLRRLKEEKRQQELNEFNSQLNSGNSAKPNLAEEFKQMDAKKQLPAGSNPEMDRRRMIYKNIRKEISEQDTAAKNKAIEQKMQAMEAKVRQREQERRLQSEQEAKQQAETDALRKQSTL